MTKPKINRDELIEFLKNQSPETKVYLGVDSECYKFRGKWYADYALAVIVHINGRNGCHIFGEIQTEPVYDRDKSKPTMRLMTEVMKAAELYLELGEVLQDRHVEIHIDVNSDDRYASNLVAQQAIGYIRGVCNLTPRIKPDAWGASFAADRLKDILQSQKAA